MPRTRVCLCARRHAVLARRGMKAVPNEAVSILIFYVRVDGPPKANFSDGVMHTAGSTAGRGGL